MSTAAISYRSLRNASSEAKSVAKKLDKYADSLYNNVYKKLDKYKGEWSSNLSAAKSQTNAKISELRSEQSKYETYASNLEDLRDECQDVDKAVRSKVSSLTASFKKTHGIRNSKIENAINYTLTDFGNKSSVGRWLGGKKDDFKSGARYLKESIKEWYNYGGGKELIKGVLVGLLEVAIGILAVAGAIMSGGAILVVIAGIVGGLITVANGAANIWNESRAYETTQANDPATGRRRSEINTLQDYWRSSFIFGDDGETYHYNQKYQNWATTLDVTSFVCTAVSLVSSFGQLSNRGLKWANGTAKIPFKDYFKPGTYGNFFKKAWGGLSSGGKQLFASIKAGDWSFLGQAVKNFKIDFTDNFKQKFFDFSKFSKGIKSTKNILGLGKDLINNDFRYEDNMTKISTYTSSIITKIVLPCTTVFKPNDLTVESDKHLYWFSPKGQVKFDFSPIVIDDFYGIMKGLSDDVIKNPIFDHSSKIVLDKLSIPDEVHIAVPPIDMPDITLAAIPSSGRAAGYAA